MSRLHLVIGMPGAGKSAFIAQKQKCEWKGVRVISYDEIRFALGFKYKQELEPLVHIIGCTMLRIALRANEVAVIDESLTEYHLASELASIAKNHGCPVYIHHVATSHNVCRQRRVHGTHYPEKDFNRKNSEWEQNSLAILALADALEVTKLLL